MKKLYLSVLFLATLLLAVSAVSAALDIETITSPSGNPGSSVNVQFTVRNTGTAAVNTIIVNNGITSTLTSGSNTINVPAIPNIINLAAGAVTPTKTFSVALPLIQSGVYTGTLTVKEEGNPTNTDSVSYSVTVNSVAALDVTDRDTSTNKLTLTGEQGEKLTGTFKVKNTGSEEITSLQMNFNQDDFTDGDDDKVTITSNIPSSIAPGVEETVTLTADLDDAIDMETYDGTITITGTPTTGGTRSDTFTLEVRVQPEVCSDGRVGDLNLDLVDPDTGDDFKPGETINIEVDVDNNADEDLDITVTAFLFDVDDSDNVEEVDSDEINIDEDDSETFEFDLVIPEDVDDSHEFRLYVKAFEDGNEDEQCDEDSVKLDIKREKHDVIVKSIRIEPSVVKSGSQVTFTVTVQNIGSRDEDDVIVRLSNAELGLDLESRSFSLEKFDDDDTAIEKFTFTIPEDVESGAYDIEAIVDFDTRTTSTFAPLRVEAPPAPPEAFATLEVSDIPTSLEAGKSFDMAVKVTNTGDASGTFAVEVADIASWANAVPTQTITLTPGRTGTLFFTIQTKEGITGVQSAAVSVLADDELLDSQTVNVELKTAQAVTGPGLDLRGLFSGTTLWIIADIVLIIIAIVFIRMLFRSRKRE